MTKPIVPWMGGKRKLAKHLLPIMHSTPHSCYVEAFAGGAALFFMREPAEIEVLNDIDAELCNMYRCVKHHLQEVVNQFRWVLVSRKQFDDFMKTPVETMTDIQRAARFLFLQKMAFGGHTHKQTFGVATTVAPGINILNLENELSQSWHRLSGVYIENRPWLKVVQQYDREHTLTYCDPPYWQTAGYGEEFCFAEYQKMAAFALDAKGSVLISINDHPDIRVAFADLHAKEVTIRYSAGVGQAAPTSELIIANFPFEGSATLEAPSGYKGSFALQ